MTGPSVRRIAGEDAERAAPAITPDEKAAAVQRMFGAVAPRYDLLNHLLSLNIDRRWRRFTVTRLLARCNAAGRVLDACAGTLDLARELAGRPAFTGHVIACDFALPMLEKGRPKTRTLGIGIACADALRLPLADASVDGAMVGFGVRNLASLDAGLQEFARVLKPGAPLVILDFTTPPRQPMRAAYLFYFRRVLPLIGRAISGHASAYRYLPESVLDFPEPAELALRMNAAGFSDVRWTRLSAGIVAVHDGVRQAPGSAGAGDSASAG